MKISYAFFSLAIIFFVFSIIRYCQTKYSTSKGTDIERFTTGDFTFPKTFINVGNQKLHVPVKVAFVVYNTSKNNLFIQNVLPDCHCTVADFSDKPIFPHDSSFITLKYDASNEGPFQSTAIVTTNFSSSPTVLIFRGIVKE